MWSVRLLFFLQVFVFLALAKEDFFINIEQGKIKGYVTNTVYNNHTYYGFKGIPYSKPMVGENKFNTPQPPDQWEGEWDAQNHRKECVQYDIILRKIKGDDDCLYLNVYTPDLNTVDCKPVMVWIHGGAFIFGSGNDVIYSPDFLIEKDVVVITFNYRLGPIGFLSTADENLPGNIGLKDQAHAIRWVRDNIQFFGGCPNQVTIFGESAGSASVQYHLLSPMSRGQFDRSIQQSGSATDEWAFSYNPRKVAFELGEAMGIHTTSSKELVDALRQKPSREIFDVAIQNMKGLTLDSYLKYLPCVEPDVPGVEIFLPDNPMNLMQAGKIADVPMIAGVNLDECALFMPEILKHVENNKEELLRELHTMLPNNMNITDVEESKQVADTIYKFYFGDKIIGNDTADELMMLLTDVAFFFQFHVTTLTIGEHIKSPIYKYLLSYRTPVGMLKNYRNLGNVSSHADDLEYIWYSRFFRNKPKPASPQERLVHIFTTMWTNFAKTGKPTLKKDDIIDVEWIPMGKENNILNIDTKLEMQKGFFPERMNFWVELYVKVLGEFKDLVTYYDTEGIASIFTLSFAVGFGCFVVQYYMNVH